MKKSLHSIGAVTFAIAISAAAGLAGAQPITPTFSSFGTINDATFGGTGIDVSNIASTNIGDTVLGLSATTRCRAENSVPYTCGGAVTVPTQGSFVAQAGAPWNNSAASWNFGIYVKTGTTAGRTYKLFYDFDPAQLNDQNTHGVINLGLAFGTGNILQGSQNLGFGYLATSFPPVIVAPTSPPTFSNTAVGTYSFALVAYDSSIEVGRSAIEVTVVPEPEAYGLALAGMGVVGFAMLRRRRATAS